MGTALAGMVADESDQDENSGDENERTRTGHRMGKRHSDKVPQGEEENQQASIDEETPHAENAGEKDQQEGDRPAEQHVRLVADRVF